MGLRAMGESARKLFLYEMKFPELKKLATKMSISILNKEKSGSRKNKRPKNKYRGKNELVKDITAKLARSVLQRDNIGNPQPVVVEVPTPANSQEQQPEGSGSKDQKNRWSAPWTPANSQEQQPEGSGSKDQKHRWSVPWTPANSQEQQLNEIRSENQEHVTG